MICASGSIRTMAVAAAALLALLTPVTRAEDDFPSLRLKDLVKQPWQQSVKAMKWSDADVEQLAKQKVLITSEAVKQVFDPYFGTWLPVFITSDSILNAHHVLFEESVLRLEQAQAAKLPKFLQAIWVGLDSVDKEIHGNPAMVQQARLRARVIIGTARSLMGDADIKADQETAALIAQEAKKVIEATAVEKPAWLGPPDDGFRAVDYSRFRPRGFYTHSVELQRYFRTVAWLQAIPFRIDRDEELLDILMVGNTVTYSRPGNHLANELLTCYAPFLGCSDDWDLRTAMQEAQNSLRLDLPKDLAPLRDQMKDSLSREGGPQIADQLRFAPEEPSQLVEPSIRILPAYRTPDGVMFHRTTDRRFQRPFPSGLDVAALLGSSFARSKLDAAHREALLKTIDGCKTFLGNGQRRQNLYAEYLHCLSALLETPEKDAPALFGSEAWQVKSCQTALGGWAQARHTWVLQAKQEFLVLGMTMQPAGFVEPVPEFFSRMATLAKRTGDTLKEAGAFEPRVDTQVATTLRELADVLEKADVVHQGIDELQNLPPEQMMRLQSALSVLPALMGSEPDDPKAIAALLASAVPKLRELATQLEKGQLPADPAVWAALQCGTGVRIEPLWRRLEVLCRRLEALAHKQLRCVPFSEGEEVFLKKYGEELAPIMLYGSNSYEVPRDDAPRVADVFSNPQLGKVMEVGIGRPRLMYLLYPWEGHEVLCRGAVMPYYEFTHGQRLTDDQWKQMLDSDSCPALPPWSQSLYNKAGLRKAQLPKDERDNERQSPPSTTRPSP